MKNITQLLVVLLLLPSFGFAGDRGDIQEFTVEGLQVILKPATNEVISAQLFIKGGTSNYSKENEGIESLAIAIATQGGTKTYNKEDFQAKLEKLGSSVGGNSSYDNANINLRCVAYSWDKSWDLYASAIMEPAFTEKQFTLDLDQMITGVKQQESNPDAKLAQLVMEDVFLGQPYSRRPGGSLKSLEHMSLVKVQNYYNKLLSKSKVILVVVGKVSREDLTNKIKGSLAKLPRGTMKKSVYKTLNISESSIKYVDRDIPTNYIMGVMNAPIVSDIKQTIAMQVAFEIFRDRLFEEIRTKRNLSYAPSAFHRRRHTSYSGVYVSTTDPDSTVKVMIHEIKKIKAKGFDADELKNKKGQFLTSYYMGQETNASQATSLGAWELRGGWENILTFVDKVYALELEDINKVFDANAKAIKWYYVGKKEQVPTSITLEKTPFRPW